MRKLALGVTALGPLVLLALVPVLGHQLQHQLPPAKPTKLATPASSAQRGAQLVTLGGCHDCHTPKLANGDFDMSRALMGHPQGAPIPADTPGVVTSNMLLTAWRGPWGLTLARNLTPDKETGIGSWTLDDFMKTMRTGVNPKGQAIRPPMPIMNLQNLPAEDLEAIYRHLMTGKPIRNAVEAPAPPAPPKR